MHVVQVRQRSVPAPPGERLTSFDHGIGDGVGDGFGPGCDSAAPPPRLVGHAPMVVVSGLGLVLVASGSDRSGYGGPVVISEPLDHIG
jgi:hypothetical protein